MNLGRKVGKQKGRMFVNDKAFNSMAQTVNKLRNIDFDERDFDTRVTGAGVLIALKNTITDGGEEFDYHYKIENNSSSDVITQCIVRGGYWVRNGTAYPTLGDYGQYQNDYANVTSITVTGDEYIIAGLDTSAGQVTFYTRTTPTYSTSEVTVGRVNTASSTINQFVVGDLVDSYIDHPWMFNPVGPLTGGFTLGKVYIGAVDKIVASWPVGNITVTETTHFYLAVDFSAATVTYGSGTSIPANTATIEYYTFCTLTVTNNRISNVGHKYLDDLHIICNI